MEVKELKDDVRKYFESIHREINFSTELIELKLDNYCNSIIDSIKFQYYNYLRTQDNKIEQIEKEQEVFNSKINCINKEKFNSKDYELDELKKTLNQIELYVNWCIDDKEKMDKRENNIFNQDIDNKNTSEDKRIRANIKKYNEEISSIKRYDRTILEEFNESFNKQLNSKISNGKLIKNRLKRELDKVNISFCEKYAENNKRELIELYKRYIEKIFNLYETSITTPSNNNLEMSINMDKTRVNKQDIEYITIETSQGISKRILIKDLKDSIKPYIYDQFIAGIIMYINNSEN